MAEALTVEKVTEMFDLCNRAFFGGRLLRPKMRVGRSRTRLGSCSIRLSRGRLKPENCTISISSYYDFTEGQLRDVMAHEMIHYSIACAGLKDSAPHGIIFRGMMDNLNRKYGLHITVMTSTANIRKTAPTRPTWRTVLAMRLTDGRCLLSVVAPRYVGQLERTIGLTREIAWHKWLRTNSSFFEGFPHVRTLRGRVVSEQVFTRFTSAAERSK